MTKNIVVTRQAVGDRSRQMQLAVASVLCWQQSCVGAKLVGARLCCATRTATALGYVGMYFFHVEKTLPHESKRPETGPYIQNSAYNRLRLGALARRTMRGYS